MYEKDPSRPEPATAQVIMMPKPSLSEFNVLLTRSWAVYRRGIKTYIKMMLLPLIGVAVIFVAVSWKLFANVIWPSNQPAIPGIDIPFIIMLFLATLFTIYLSLVSQAAVLIAIKEDGRPGVFSDLFKRAHGLILPLFWVGSLSAVIVIFSFFLLIVPGFIAAINFTLASWVLVYEGKLGYAALRESKRLVYGYRWTILGRIGLLYAIFVLAGMVVGVVINALPENSLLTGLFSLFINAAQFALGPLFIIFQREIYLELKALNPAQTEYAS